MKRFAFLTMVLFLAASTMYGYTPGTERAHSSEAKKEQKSEKVPLKKLEGKEINSVAKNNFITMYGNIPNVKWERSPYFDEASFTKDGKSMKAFYDYDGQLVGTTTVIKFSDVPAEGQKEIKKMYKDYTVGNVIFYDDNEANQTDMMLYGKQFDDADNYFVELGKGTKRIVVQINPQGELFFFKEM